MWRHCLVVFRQRFPIFYTYTSLIALQRAQYISLFSLTIVIPNQYFLYSQKSDEHFIHICIIVLRAVAVFSYMPMPFCQYFDLEFLPFICAIFHSILLQRLQPVAHYNVFASCISCYYIYYFIIYNLCIRIFDDQLQSTCLFMYLF